MPVTIFFLFILGLIVGSFISVASCDPDGVNWVKRKRSKCEQCGHILGFFDLLPVVSFIVLRGKCRYCQKNIAPWHLISELFTAGLFICAYFANAEKVNSELVLILLSISLLVLLTANDLRHWTLPDTFVGALAVVGILKIFVTRNPDPYWAILGCITGIVLLGSISFFSGGRAMGWGDVKLAGAMGILLGFGPVLLALMLAFVIGGVVGMVLIALKKAGRKSMIPFGPFLTISTVVFLLVPVLYEKVLIFYGLM